MIIIIISYRIEGELNKTTPLTSSSHEPAQFIASQNLSESEFMAVEGEQVMDENDHLMAEKTASSPNQNKSYKFTEISSKRSRAYVTAPPDNSRRKDDPPYQPKLKSYPRIKNAAFN